MRVSASSTESLTSVPSSSMRISTLMSDYQLSGEICRDLIAERLGGLLRSDACSGHGNGDALRARLHRADEVAQAIIDSRVDIGQMTEPARHVPKQIEERDMRAHVLPDRHQDVVPRIELVIDTERRLPDV